jgi:hypothetical protein
MTRPASHSFAPRFDWHYCDVEGLETFAILVRPTITNREREMLVEKHQTIVEYEVAWVKAGPERDPEDTPRLREMQLLAPYIKDWNAVGLLEDGTEAPIPAPADAGPEAFLAIDTQAYDWIVRHILLGYRASGKAGGWGSASPRSRGMSPDTSEGDQN